MRRFDLFAVVLGMVTMIWAAPAAAVAEEAPQPGLLSVMFESTDLTRPTATGITVFEQVNVDTGVKINDYSRLWIGRIKGPTDGEVELFAEADDGVRVAVGGQTVIDGWAKDGARAGRFTARKGELLPLRVDYFQDGGTGFVRLYWSWDAHSRELIPANALLHTPADRQEAERIMAAAGPQAAEPVPPASPDLPDKSFIYEPGRKYPTTAPATAGDAVPAHPGPHLFVDDYLIASAQNVSRTVRQPVRDSAIPNPVVNAKQDQSFQPYMSVSRSPETGRFRIWYGIATPDKSTHTSALAYMESDDGVRWARPHRVLEIPRPMQFGSEVLDRGPYWPDPSQRYVYSYWFGGLRLAVSGDGLHFRPLVDRPVVLHNHDIDSLSWDALRQRYVATMSTFMSHPRFKGVRRTTMQSTSENLLDWTPPFFVLVADNAADEGETQFYAMEAFFNRGPLRIGMVKILRDDLFSDTKEVLEQRGGGFGTGYTTLAWTRDGQHWIRDREVFFDRGPEGAWDRSHAWIDEQVMVGDDVYLYYGGYRSGHKANRFDDRQIGLVKMPLDRYVARQAGEQGGTLLTVPIKLDERAKRLLVNADAAAGEVRVQLREAGGKAAIDGLGFDDCRPVTADGLRTEILWGDEAQTRRKLAALNGKTVQLEFTIKNASLFSFEFVDDLEHGSGPAKPGAAR
jgi:hypothetical protein